LLVSDQVPIILLDSDVQKKKKTQLTQYQNVAIEAINNKAYCKSKNAIGGPFCKKTLKLKSCHFVSCTQHSLSKTK
jgi:hypothetical protein